MEKAFLWWSLIDAAVVLGVALVLPVCLGHRRWWTLAALAVAGACAMPAGSAGAEVLGGIWLVVAVGVVLATLWEAGSPTRWSRRQWVAVIAGGYAVVAATWFELSRIGATPLGISEPIVELTAVHFTYVGVAALTLALAAFERAPSRRGRQVGLAAVALTAGAPVLVAIGFTVGNALAQIGGAVLVSAGVFCTAGLQLTTAARRGRRGVRLALGVSGASVWAPMVLAVLWASAQHFEVWALGIDAMVRTHGAVNALGFVAAGLVGLCLERRCACGEAEVTVSVSDLARVAPSPPGRASPPVGVRGRASRVDR